MCANALRLASPTTSRLEKLEYVEEFNIEFVCACSCMSCALNFGTECDIRTFTSSFELVVSSSLSLSSSSSTTIARFVVGDTEEDCDISVIGNELVTKLVDKLLVKTGGGTVRTSDGKFKLNGDAVATESDVKLRGDGM